MFLSRIFPIQQIGRKTEIEFVFVELELCCSGMPVSLMELFRAGVHDSSQRASCLCPRAATRLRVDLPATGAERGG